MTTTHPSTAPAALVRACERLVAERGFKGVTASEVVRLAEQRNNSAIAYHFERSLVAPHFTQLPAVSWRPHFGQSATRTPGGSGAEG